MNETRYCNICKQELESENHSHICRSCNNKILNIETKVDELKDHTKETPHIGRIRNIV